MGETSGVPDAMSVCEARRRPEQTTTRLIQSKHHVIRRLVYYLSRLMFHKVVIELMNDTSSTYGC